MFRRKDRIEVVPESEYTDFSHRDPSDAYATNKTLAVATALPITTAIGLTAYSWLNVEPAQITATTIPVSAPVNVMAEAPPIIPLSSTPEMVPVGFIAESSLNTLANVLDPVVQILTAISFPIASVIMVGACFFFMFGNSEKAWSMIMNAGLGYVLIQLSPLFLEILREVGKAV